MPASKFNKKYFNEYLKSIEIKFEKLISLIVSIKRVANNNNIILKNKTCMQYLELDTHEF